MEQFANVRWNQWARITTREKIQLTEYHGNRLSEKVPSHFYSIKRSLKN